MNLQESFAPETKLSVEGISVVYGAGAARLRALDEVTLGFPAAGLTLVMGPSGSGKTTLLSVLGCLLTPDSGDVRVMDHLVTDWPEERKAELRRRQIGFVFQTFRLFHSLSALENVLLALDLAGARGRAAKESAGRALDVVGLADKGGLHPNELSGGEQQRVAIARALVNDPPIILADEPTASLDSQSGEQIAELLFNLAATDQRLVVVVSHDPRWLDYGQRTITLRDGRVIEDKESQ